MHHDHRLHYHAIHKITDNLHVPDEMGVRIDDTNDTFAYTSEALATLSYSFIMCDIVWHEVCRASYSQIRGNT